MNRIIYIEITIITQGMAETDISHEFGREPGFSSLVFSPKQVLMGVTHGGSTEMSAEGSIIER